MADAPKRTPLHSEHLRLGAKMVPFAGYEMPIQYPAGIVAEHHAVRDGAGIFDVSHMGELFVSGRDALELVQHLITNDASVLEVGQAQYTVMCRDDGGVIDDLIIYRLPDGFMIVVNASNVDKDREWIEAHAGGLQVELDDRTEETALIALQGPEAETVLERITDVELASIDYYRFSGGEVGGHRATISRTGYTGEDGFELYLDAEHAATVWRELLAAGEPEGILPCGLGARDSLRLEMGYALYGNDLDEEHTPLEGGLGWVVKLEKEGFVGRGALERQKEEGVERRLSGFVLLERGFPRKGYELSLDGAPVGKVTSGVHSPTLEQGIGLAYVAAELASPGTELELVIRDRAVPARVTRPPFYRHGSVKR